jgi:hypothetical protein
MTTDRHVWLADHPGEPDCHQLCACGQDLDMTSREHCPRCGVQVR